MKIKYKSGDLFAGKESAICHVCNAKGVFNAGFARVIRRNFPEAFSDYNIAYKENRLKLGSIIWTKVNCTFIGNMICQQTYGYEKQRYISYDALDIALDSINNFCSGVFDKVAFPLIGTGLAGGNWHIIEAIIEHNARLYKPIVYVLDDNIP